MRDQVALCTFALRELAYDLLLLVIARATLGSICALCASEGSGR